MCFKLWVSFYSGHSILRLETYSLSLCYAFVLPSDNVTSTCYLLPWRRVVTALSIKRLSNNETAAGKDGFALIQNSCLATMPLTGKRIAETKKNATIIRNYKY
jgi:hypothetical protein